jgi:hypothetical protein
MIKGIISNDRNHVIVDDKKISITKTQKNHNYEVGTEVGIEIGTEYPEDCDNNPFCEGDETCSICLINNKIAIIKI